MSTMTKNRRGVPLYGQVAFESGTQAYIIGSDQKREGLYVFKDAVDERENTVTSARIVGCRRYSNRL